jgi:hypothetical protein
MDEPAKTGWSQETPDIPYLALHTDKGTRAIPLGLLYNAQLTDESMTIGELIVDYDDCIQPDADLTGDTCSKSTRRSPSRA